MRKASGSIPDISTFALVFSKQRKWHWFGLDRDLNPGPLAPEARIIPLDHQAMHSQPSATPIKGKRTPGHTEGFLSLWHKKMGEQLKMICPGWGSNSRPSDYETDALPTALPRLGWRQWRPIFAFIPKDHTQCLLSFWVFKRDNIQNAPAVCRNQEECPMHN